MEFELRASDTLLPAPVEMMVNDEIIWSANTGRSASGKMLGDVVAEKGTVTITWGILPETDVATIQNAMPAGFFPLKFPDGGATRTITVYRGPFEREQLGYVGDGLLWYRSVSVELVQQ